MRRSSRRRRGQQMLEVILLCGLVCLAIAWITVATRDALLKNYHSQQKLVASPL